MSGLRVGVVGASGALGTELVHVLGERRFPVDDLVPVGTSRSIGREIELADESFPILTEIPRLAALDLVFLCAPPAASLDYARAALAERVPCLDLSGALAGQPDVPLLVADLAASPDELGKPVVATPAGAASALALVLAPFAHDPGLRRVVATSLEAVSGAGQQGIESLSREVLAIFNQRDLPEPDVFDRPVAFDCLPAVGETVDAGHTEPELELARDVRRLLGSDLPIAVTRVRVPTFSGDGLSLAVELAHPLPAQEAAARLAKAPGLELSADSSRPSTRDSSGEEAVRVGRLRSDPSLKAGLLLWASVDPLRVAAVNAVKLAETRFAAR